MERAYYSDNITAFIDRDEDTSLGKLSGSSQFDVTQSQRDAWLAEIRIMKGVLTSYRGRGKVYFEYDIPRLGGRIDVLAIIENVIFVIEFKVGAKECIPSAVDQVYDYALDLKNFHETSHTATIAPILVATNADSQHFLIETTPQKDKLLAPISINAKNLPAAIRHTLDRADGEPIDAEDWECGRYSPTPTIIEAATALYSGHAVQEISRSEAGAINLRNTSDTIAEIIRSAKTHSHKAICFVTGVPGAGKTLVGLDIATKHIDKDSDLYSVFLSGNGPLVNILREALARDKVRRGKESGGPKTHIGAARREVKAFIQNVHNFRDDCIRDKGAPLEHVALFDEAQRAWSKEQTTNFMKHRKGISDFDQSEPAFLISCLDRHTDWATIVCLVGGGQEINTGEAGIGEWIKAITEKFPQWKMYLSPRLTENEYNVEGTLAHVTECPTVVAREELHLSVSMRSFRAEHVSLLVKQLLDLDYENARQTLHNISERYPIVLTRDVHRAKAWLRQHARGSERYGIVVSSHAERLKPHAIDVRPKVNPIHWFLHGKEDVRSSYYLEDVVTEFDIQGLEMDWVCLTWDADFRYTPQGWGHWSFHGDRWKHIHKPERKTYLKNAYRVLLTRARQGMVIVIPEGDSSDPTRNKSYYDPTFDYLCSIGFRTI
ncbi:MAG: DUF2075 domain-containing protein [Nitrospira sp.]|nr:DUF2075 domain-containing protein [Nitrospira sp.]MDD9859388.1 DUF2075 domain-containing protein [Nitrospira sp.]